MPSKFSSPDEMCRATIFSSAWTDRIVKEWLDSQGNMQERVFDIIWSDSAGRKIGKNGKLAPVGDTVDLASASYTNSIGAAQLMTTWSDASFDSRLTAFHYVRVL